MLPRSVRIMVGVCALSLCAACGGGAPRASSADLVALRQPTPDPTLDAVVRNLPRALAGVVQASPTPTPKLTKAATATSTPTPKPTARPR